jgi:YfiH family protein
MLIHNSPLFQIFFGDERNSCIPADFNNVDNLLHREPFITIADDLDMEHLAFAHQVHGTQGIVIDSLQSAQTLRPFSVEGDYLVTNVPHEGLGVMTADCVPLVVYDKVHHVLAVIHAGWKGLVNGVIPAAIERMSEEFKTAPSQLRVFIGPCAKSCCYVIGDEVLDALDRFSYKDRVICETEHGFHFDMPLFALLQLKELGVAQSACNMGYNECTMCSPGFCSYRRDKTQRRNGTIAVLK